MRKIILTLGLLALPGMAQAHNLGATLSFTDGLLHPLTGVDHLGAAIAIGVLAARRDGAGSLMLPVTFTLALVAGFLTAGGATAGLIMEGGVIASALLLLGLAAAPVERTSLLLAVTIPAGLMHGYVHGAGLTGTHEGAYLTGLIAATGGIHAGAFLVVRYVRKRAPVHHARIHVIGRH